MVFAATSDAEEFDDDIWICDSGASSHYCVSDRGMFDVRNIDEKYWSVSLIFLTQVLIEFSLIHVHRLAILNVRTVMRTTMF
jgi:hypothetical protein